jgi:hypothetical protein
MNIATEMAAARRALKTAHRSEEVATAVANVTGRAEDRAMAEEARAAALTISNSLGSLEAAISEYGIEELQRRIDAAEEES